MYRNIVVPTLREQKRQTSAAHMSVGFVLFADMSPTVPRPFPRTGLLGSRKNSLVRLARYSGVDSSEVPSIIRDHVRGRLRPKSGASSALFVWIAWLLFEERLDPRWVITKFGFLASGRKATR